MTTELRGEGLVLRAVLRSDAEAIAAACAGSDLARFIPGFPDPYTREDADRFTERAAERWESEAFTYAITAEESGELLGMIELAAPEERAAGVGYWVKDGARRRGVATRALELVSRWAIDELGVARLWLTTAPENAASQRVAEKAGFTREALLRAHVRVGGERRDSVLYSLLPTDLAAG